MLDYDGSGTVGTEEFCDGVIKAANGVTPVEMSRLIKQNTDILHNSRSVIALLRGEDVDIGSLDGSGTDEEGKKPPPDEKPKQQRRRSSVAFQQALAMAKDFDDNDTGGAAGATRVEQHQKAREEAMQAQRVTQQRVKGLEERVSNMERTINSMRSDVSTMVHTMTKLSNLSMRPSSHHQHGNLKRAVAVCRGPIGSGALANHPSTSSSTRF